MSLQKFYYGVGSSKEVCQIHYLAKFQFEIVEGFVSGSLSPELNNISDLGRHFAANSFFLCVTIDPKGPS